MKSTLVVVLLGLSLAFAAEKEKKTTKRGTLEESLAYGYGLGASGFDLNKSFRSSLGSDVVAVDAVDPNRAIHAPITQIPQTFDLGATVSRHTTYTKNIGISVPQQVPVSLERTVQVAIPQSVQVPGPQTYQVPVPQTYQVPVPQTYQVQVPHTVQVPVPHSVQVQHAVEVSEPHSVQVPVHHAVQVPFGNALPVHIAQQVPVHIERTIAVQRPLVVSLYNVPLVQQYPTKKEVYLTAPATYVSSGVPAQVYANSAPHASAAPVQIAAPESIPSPLTASSPVAQGAGPLTHGLEPAAPWNQHADNFVAPLASQRNSFVPHASNSELFNGPIAPSKDSYYKL